MSDEDAAAALQTDIGKPYNLNIISNGDGTFNVTAGGNKFSRAFSGPSRLTKGMIKVGFPDDGIISTVARYRTLTRYYLAGILHPLERLKATKDADIKSQLGKWWESLKNSFQTGEDSFTADTTHAQSEETGADGKPIITAVEDGTAGTIPSSETQGILSGLGGLKGTASALGIALATAVICALEEIDKNIGLIRYAQVIAPMTRMATAEISVGNQIMSGQDVDMNEVGQLAQQFNSVNAQGQVTSNWSDAATIQSDTGGGGGIDLDQSTKSLFSGAPSWLSWTTSAPVTAFCSQVVQIGATVLSFVVGTTGVGLLFTIATSVAGYFAIPAAIKAADNLLSGQAVNVNASGAEWGNYIDYGARLAANAQAVQYGGTALNSQQSAQLSAQNQTESQQQFHSESLADRLFNPNDYRSLVGNMIDKLSPGGWQMLASFASNISSIFGSLIQTPASLLSAVGWAATPSYQYPFPEIGFSQQDLNNPLVQDPNANALAATQILNNSPQSSQYIQLALDCFGVDITNGPQGWDVIPTTQNPTDSGFTSQYLNRSYGVDVYDSATYQQSECQSGLSPNDSNWLIIRFFILDTGVFEGYACYLGDDVSCSNDGFTSASLISGQGGVPSGS